MYPVPPTLKIKFNRLLIVIEGFTFEYRIIARWSWSSVCYAWFLERSASSLLANSSDITRGLAAKAWRIAW